MTIDGTVVWAAWLPIAALVVYFETRREAGLWRTLGVVALTTYAFWIASVAFFLMPFVPPGMPRDGDIRWLKLNLVPLRQVLRTLQNPNWHQTVRELGGNLLLLVPLTLLGPVLWPWLRAWRWALVIGVGVSVSIELLQLALCALLQDPYRSVDIDDVIVNTVGALLGYALFVGGRGLLRRSRRGAPPVG
jgi:glycopeptide antibiotics resistance protein